MTLSARTTTTWVLAVAIVLVATATLVLYVLNHSSPEIPQIDLSAMEPRVSTLIRVYSNAVKSNPDSADAWANLAQAFHAHDLFTQAIAAYAEAMALQPNDSRWPYLAALAKSQSDPRAALPLFQQAIELQAANAAVYINYGDILMRLGQHAEAQQAYRHALTINPDSAHALYGLAQGALMAQELQEAVSLLERARTFAPHHGAIYSLLAQAHQRLGNMEAASRQALLASAWPDSTRAADPVALAMETMAVDSQSITSKGVSLAKRFEYKEAEAAFREVLEIRPGNARDYANLGGALAGQGRLEEALAAYRKGLEIDPSDVDTLNNLGYTLIQSRDYNGAERYLQRAVELEPGFAAALGNLGLLAEQRQQPELAIDYYQQALEQNPGLLSARNALASQLAMAGDMETASALWRTVLDVNPNELTAIFNLANSLAARGEHAEAIGYLRQGLAIAPNSSRLVAALAWELATAPEDELRNGTEAVQLAQRVYSAFSGQPQMIDIMAAALAETGDFDNAIKLIEKPVAAGVGDTTAMALRLKAYRLNQPWRQATSRAILPISDQ